jgi:cytochrome c2
MDDAIFCELTALGAEVFMKLILVCTIFLGIGVAQAADIENGNDLHFTDCTGCHDSSVYTRADRKVGDLPRLGQQVRFCKDTVGVTWFDDEVEDVIAYLNATYYKF